MLLFGEYANNDIALEVWRSLRGSVAAVEEGASGQFSESWWAIDANFAPISPRGGEGF